MFVRAEPMIRPRASVTLLDELMRLLDADPFLRRWPW
jgi:hypothetical protein